MRRRVACAAALALCAALSCGCYQRVVSSRGPASVRDPVEEPYQERYLIDDVVFGEEER